MKLKNPAAAPKDKRAFIFYIITTLVLWQLGDSIKNLCTRADVMALTKDNPLLSFVYLKNTGGAFSIFTDKTALLAAFGAFVLIFTVFWCYKNLQFEEKFKILSLTCLTAGVLGNLAERISNGYVVDFVKLNFINFAVFNFFDILITLSILFLIVFYILKK